MLRDEVVDVIVRRLGNREDLKDDIILEMQIAQEVRLEMNGEVTPSFLVTEQAVASTTASEPRVELPSDFLIEVEEQGLWYQSEEGNWLPICKGPADKLELRYGSSEGAPLHYALVGNYFELYPTPDKVYKLRMNYAQAQPSLKDNIENAWTSQGLDLLLAEVGFTVASEVMQDDKLATRFDKVAAWRRLEINEVAKEEANRSRIFGGEF